jgi:hypothetical protein
VLGARDISNVADKFICRLTRATAEPVGFVAVMDIGNVVLAVTSVPVYLPYNLPEQIPSVNPSGNVEEVYLFLVVLVRQSTELSVVPSICLPSTVSKGDASVNSSVESIVSVVPETG